MAYVMAKKEGQQILVLIFAFAGLKLVPLVMAAVFDSEKLDKPLGKHYREGRLLSAALQTRNAAMRMS